MMHGEECPNSRAMMIDQHSGVPSIVKVSSEPVVDASSAGQGRVQYAMLRVQRLLKRGLNRELPAVMNGLPYEPHIALDRLFAVDETPEQDAILFGEMIGEFPRDNVVAKSHSDSRSSSISTQDAFESEEDAATLSTLRATPRPDG